MLGLAWLYTSLLLFEVFLTVYYRIAVVYLFFFVFLPGFPLFEAIETEKDITASW